MVNESIDQAHVHWLFKPTPGGFARLVIQVFPDGDYWVHDSPTGTYAAAHADKGKWRSVYERYLAEGYVPEDEAKASGLVPDTWTDQVPSIPSARQRRKARLWAGAVVLLLVAASILLTWLMRYLVPVLFDRL